MEHLPLLTAHGTQLPFGATNKKISGTQEENPKQTHKQFKRQKRASSYLLPTRAFQFRAGAPSRLWIVWDDRLFTAEPTLVDHGAGIVLYHCLSRLPYEDDPLDADIVTFMSHPPVGPGHEAPTHLPLGELAEVAHPIGQADIIPDDDDLSSTSPSMRSEDEDWYSVVIYSVSHIPVAGRAVWTSYERLHRSLADLLEVNPHDLQAFWHVTKAPTDLEAAATHVFVSLLHWGSLPGSNLRLALLDVEFYSDVPTLQPQVVREARLIPHWVTRRQLFAALGIDRYCDELASRGCLFWLNGALQQTRYTGHHVVEHGDYLRIAIPPDPDFDQAVDTRTAVGL